MKIRKGKLMKNNRKTYLCMALTSVLWLSGTFTAYMREPYPTNGTVIMITGNLFMIISIILFLSWLTFRNFPTVDRKLPWSKSHP